MSTLGLLLAGSASTYAHYGKKCTGSKNCNICKNCKYCAKDGGESGVCK